MLSLLILAVLSQTPDCANPCPCSKPAECATKGCNCGEAAKLKAEIKSVACPTCGVNKNTIAVCPPMPPVTGCPEGCRCPFPGACGHPGCKCPVMSGWKPPVDEWRIFTANPAYEVYGREVAENSGSIQGGNARVVMVFRYTHWRLRQAVPQLPATVGVKAPN